MARLVEGVGSTGSPTHTQEDCVENVLGTLKLFAQFTVFMLERGGFGCSIHEVPGWSCAASYFCITSHTAEHPM
eukprot:1158696-Pelagomonas_calceolata.AAC.2